RHEKWILNGCVSAHANASKPPERPSHRRYAHKSDTESAHMGEGEPMGDAGPTDGSELHIHAVDDAVLVVRHGPLDLALASQLRALLRDALRPGAEVVLDLTDVPLVDASIVGVLAGQLAHARD